jgi:alanyl-tRNA synthetase
MKKLYHENSYIKELETKVKKQFNENNLTYIIPEETIIYPEGGGQPSDKGFINNTEIIDIKIKNDMIAYGIKDIINDEHIKMSIDFDKRYIHMQQHTGQHLLSEIIMRKFNAQTLSFSIGENHSSIEINLKSISEENIKELEKECFNLILENRIIKTYIIDDKDPIINKLRKPPEVKDNIRVVEIDDFDYSACGGTHLKSTGELGILKIIKTDKVRGNIRLYYVAGYRALKDYQDKNTIIMEIRKELGKQIYEIPETVRKFKIENEGLRKELKHLKKIEMEKEIEVAKNSKENFIIREFNNFEIKDIKYFAKKIVDSGKNLLVYSKAPKQYMIVATNNKNIDLRKHSNEIFTLLSGRGGGRDDFIEGRVEDFSKINELMEYLRDKLDF